MLRSEEPTDSFGAIIVVVVVVVVVLGSVESSKINKDNENNKPQAMMAKAKIQSLRSFLSFTSSSRTVFGNKRVLSNLAPSMRVLLDGVLRSGLSNLGAPI